MSSYLWGVECRKYLVEAFSNLFYELAVCVEPLCLCQLPPVLAK
jgi:hypothetical protein